MTIGIKKTWWDNIMSGAWEDFEQDLSWVRNHPANTDQEQTSAVVDALIDLYFEANKNKLERKAI
jgi:hypothetical protein